MISNFRADAVLFDMDGTLTDSIAAVEAAWGKVAKDIGQDPAYVIAATHGKRAIDNLSQFKPHILPHQMDSEVQDFENTILYFADAYKTHGPGSQRTSPPPYSESAVDSEFATPSLTPGSSAPSSRASSFAFDSSRRPSFASKLSSALMMSAVPEAEVVGSADFEDSYMEENQMDIIEQQWNDKSKIHQLQAWQIEAAAVDRSVRILPGVKKMIESIPAGRYAVATSGAKTYAYGCMTRVGITPPPVTITADDKRLKAGKPAPDPFLLAAKCLGYDPKKCVVFEDSPSGIRAGVASGATVIAVCTSHERSKIENCGAHFIVENMEKVRCDVVDGQLEFTILA
ncbi:HAD-like protein [Lentinula raphanica]|uniref:HAD-like protein n=1 Tax=Lentinula raphanica TaxID=153919 RepID=A0AA38U9G9_9AGAR|nr:HAD-like protein [Lentinula raphanica]KAJ3825372.1 HAD-like protein [Lentinula raphanica]KAJ3834927.1 HAD-like protein [Lentinula raphanica]KAJ3975711.1 HAD-like protein [Lentinula raphanica]